MNILRKRRGELADSGAFASGTAVVRNAVKQVMEPPSAGDQERIALEKEQTPARPGLGEPQLALRSQK